MKRFLLCALSAFLVAASLGLTGCEGGGIPEGLPETTKPDIPPDKMKEMANMASGATPPPGAKAVAPKSGAAKSDDVPVPVEKK